MRIIAILLFIVFVPMVHSAVEWPKAITAEELPGVWHALKGQGLAVYRLEISSDLSAEMFLTYVDTETTGMDIFPNGKLTIEDGLINLQFEESPTTYEELHLEGKGISCSEGECLLVLRNASEDGANQELLWFYRKSLSELSYQIMGAEEVFEKFR